MDKRIGVRSARGIAAFIVALDAVALITGYLGIGTAPKIAGLIVAGAVAIWLYRRDSGDPKTLPRISEFALVAGLAGTVGFGAAWWSGRDVAPSRYSFVAVPRNIVAMVSLAPQAHTEVESAGLLRYGTRLAVICYVVGSNKRVWYELAEGYFVSERDVKPAPLSAGDPPHC
ncbi:MAG: hypothetical protein ACRDLN_00805 [Solirubrobacteraceae bacterium]